MCRHTFSGLSALLVGFTAASQASAVFVGVPFIVSDTPVLYQSSTLIKGPMAGGGLTFSPAVHWEVIFNEQDTDADGVVDDLLVTFTHLTAPHPGAGDLPAPILYDIAALNTQAVITGPAVAVTLDFPPLPHPAAHFDDITMRLDPFPAFGAGIWKISVQISHIDVENFVPPAIPEGGFDHIIPSPGAVAAMTALIIGTISQRRRVS